MEGRNELLLRVYLVFFAFFLLAMIIMAKVVKTAVVEGDKWKAEGGKNIKLVEVEGERGNIYSANGNLLATSLPYFDIKVDLLVSSDANFYKHIDALSKSLAKHFGKTATQWKTELVSKRNSGKAGKNSGARYYSLLNRVTKDELDLLKTFPLFNLGRYKGGLLSDRKSSRERPFKILAERTIGKDRSNAEKVGLERTYDGPLSGKVEKKLMRRLPGDVWLPIQDYSDLVREKGSDIVTTLDMHIQDIAHSELESVLMQNQADKGVAVVMDVKSGAIKAMVNLRSDNAGGYVESYNDAIGSRSEPGSTFKLISALVMLESGKLDLDTEVSMFGGRKKFYNLTMNDSELHGTQSGTFKEAFAMSSNVGVSYAAHKIFGQNMEGWKAFYSGLDEMRVTSQTGIKIYGEKKPNIKNPEKRKKGDKLNWSGTTVPWMAHGYELEMTPLQMLSFYNAVANDGKMMKPYLVSEIKDAEGTETKFMPTVLNERIASPSTIQKAQELLKAVAESGTARKLNVDGLTFAGKTGTTRLEYWIKDAERKKYNASFAGYFPEKNPKYSVIVVVYNPSGRDFYGAKVAGPVFRNIMSRLSGYEKTVDAAEIKKEPSVLQAHVGHKADYKKVLEYIGIGYKESGKGNWVEMKGSEERLTLKEKTVSESVLPDVRGKGVRDAVFILEALGMEVEVEGIGKVYTQSILPGSALKEKHIKLYLG